MPFLSQCALSSGPAGAGGTAPEKQAGTSRRDQDWSLEKRSRTGGSHRFCHDVSMKRFKFLALIGIVLWVTTLVRIRGGKKPPSDFSRLSILKTSFALSQLNLHGRNDSLQTLCLRSFSRCSVQFGKDFELGLRFKPRSLPFGISSWSFSAQSVHTRCV